MLIKKTGKGYVGIKHRINNIYRSLRRVVLTALFIVVQFICYGDLPTPYYIKKGMKIGCNFYRQTATKFDPSHCYLIEIGDNVTVANNVQILAHDQSQRYHMGYGKVGRVVIGNNTFLGARSTILPNVTIGEDVIIGAGSVVTKSIPSGSVAVGIPAKVIGTTQDYIEKCRKELTIRPCFDGSYCGTKLGSKEKEEIRKACNDGFAYIKLGRVLDYKKESRNSGK